MLCAREDVADRGCLLNEREMMASFVAEQGIDGSMVLVGTRVSVCVGSS